MAGVPSFVSSRLTEWGVAEWCASMERCASGLPHVHFMVQFFAASDRRVVDVFSFNGASALRGPWHVLRLRRQNWRGLWMRRLVVHGRQLFAMLGAL